MPEINTFSFYLNIFFIAMAIILVIYSVLYEKEALKIRDQLGVSLPKQMNILLSFNVVISLFSLLIIAFLAIAASLLLPR